MTTFERVINKIAPVVLVAAGLVLIAFFVIQSGATNTENNGYVRVINCIISIPATKRTQTDINNCYADVEKELGIHLQRYNRYPN